MNIAVVMGILSKANDLDPMAKAALLALACRAGQDTDCANVSTARLAKDMCVNRSTAWRALKRLVDKGCISVEDWPGQPSLWRVNASRYVDTSRRAQQRDVAHRDALPFLFKDPWIKDAAAPLSLATASDAAVDNQPGSEAVPLEVALSQLNIVRQALEHPAGSELQNAN